MEHIPKMESKPNTSKPKPTATKSKSKSALNTGSDASKLFDELFG